MKVLKTLVNTAFCLMPQVLQKVLILLFENEWGFYDQKNGNYRVVFKIFCKPPEPIPEVFLLDASPVHKYIS
jgi:hypothetical protein